jgi:GH25 family lysozyme M1 (1,4-beta-N-acetylmuramidase)
MEAKCIDVSSYQKTIDFKKVKASGVDNVIIRCGFTGYGLSHSKNKDDFFEAHYKNAKSAGMNVGVYYYSCAVTEKEAIEEAEFVLSLLKGKQFELPIYMDVEDAHDLSERGVYPENQKTIGKKRLTDAVDAFCRTLEKAGYFVGFYAAKSWIGNNLDMSVLNKYTLWLAHWVDKTDYSGAFGVWQYTSSGIVNGISGNVDMNIVYEDFPSIIKNNGFNGFEKKSSVLLKGDINGDGVVDTADARLAMRASVGLENLSADQIKRGDVDGDGKISPADAREILRMSVGLNADEFSKSVNDTQIVGDLNGDGKVDVDDIIFLIDIIKKQK